MSGGFKSPLFVLGLSSVTTQGGYRTPIPNLPMGGAGGIQAGFVTPIPVLSFGAIAVSTAVKIQFGKKFYEKKSLSSKKRRKSKILALLRDEEELMIILEIIKRIL